MRNLIKKITHPFLKLGLKLYYFKPRVFCYDNIHIKVHPTVFPPHLTLSTKILLDFITSFELKDKSFLELGCGSGIISLLASKKGALVTATDINTKALEYLERNAKVNQLAVEIIHSNLFDTLKHKTFDFIIINPPYYPKKPKNIAEEAWFCGENFEYFEKLFYQLPNYILEENKCYMILSEDCEIEKIKKIALKNNLLLRLQLEKTQAFEKNYIFTIVKN